MTSDVALSVHSCVFAPFRAQLAIRKLQHKILVPVTRMHGIVSHKRCSHKYMNTASAERRSGDTQAGNTLAYARCVARV